MSNPTELPSPTIVPLPEPHMELCYFEGGDPYPVYNRNHMHNYARDYARAVLARRAQPEGEVPKAEHSRFGSPEMQARILSNLAPATLSPLCAAQHDEDVSDILGKMEADPKWRLASYSLSAKFSALKAEIRCATLAAQQAAAPGIDALAFFTALEVFKKSDQGVTAAQNFIDAIGPSAPGTPEAPKGGVA